MLVVKENTSDVFIATNSTQLIHKIIGFTFSLIGFGNFCILLFKIDVSELKIQVLSVPSSIIFLLIGVVFLFGRRSLTINSRKRTMTSWYGVLIPLYIKTFYIHQLEYITLKKHRIKKGSGSTALTPVYVVNVVTSNDKKIFIDRSQSYDDSYDIALLFAYTLKKPFKDSSTGHEMTRDLAKVKELMKKRQRQHMQSKSKLLKVN